MKSITISVALVLIGAGSVHANGASEHAGERGDLVAEAKADRQGETGEKNAWGKRVSARANGSMENPYGNLGGYLRERSVGPSGSK